MICSRRPEGWCAICSHGSVAKSKLAVLQRPDSTPAPPG
jgi:hypothetical protein